MLLFDWSASTVSSLVVLKLESMAHFSAAILRAACRGGTNDRGIYIEPHCGDHLQIYTGKRILFIIFRFI